MFHLKEGPWHNSPLSYAGEDKHLLNLALSINLFWVPLVFICLQLFFALKYYFSIDNITKLINISIKNSF